MKILSFIFAILLAGSFAMAKPTPEKAPLNCVINLPNPNGNGEKTFVSQHDDYSGNEKATYIYNWTSADKNVVKTYYVTAETWKGYAQGSKESTTMGYLKVEHNGDYVINHCQGEPCKTELTLAWDSIGFTVDCTTK